MNQRNPWLSYLVTEFLCSLLHLEALASTHLYQKYSENFERQVWHLSDEDIFIISLL